MGEVNGTASAVRRPSLSASVAYEEADMGVTTIASARDFAADFLTAAPAAGGEPVPQERVDVARLVVSELVTNAVRHAPGPFRVLLEWFEDALDISVADRLDAAPAPRPHDPQRVGQHGLEIVVAVCESVRVERELTGKRVRARLSLA
ncbi:MULTISPECIES: ATP-binding protein [unclassified Streptomyces]|uniref:ATP-binding protein n=1 Tax=unclassified Streptomyces TaxID=2593676 RepID=UPI00332E6D76